MRKLTKTILPKVRIENLKIRSRGDNRCESANNNIARLRGNNSRSPAKSWPHCAELLRQNVTWDQQQIAARDTDTLLLQDLLFAIQNKRYSEVPPQHLGKLRQFGHKFGLHTWHTCMLRISIHDADTDLRGSSRTRLLVLPLSRELYCAYDDLTKYLKTASVMTITRLKRPN